MSGSIFDIIVPTGDTKRRLDPERSSPKSEAAQFALMATQFQNRIAELEQRNMQLSAKVSGGGAGTPTAAPDSWGGRRDYTKLTLAIGRRIRASREALMESQADFAARIGVTRGYLSDLERGTREMSLEVFARLCDMAVLQPTDIMICL